MTSFKIKPGDIDNALKLTGFSVDQLARVLHVHPGTLWRLKSRTDVAPMSGLPGAIVHAMAQPWFTPGQNFAFDCAEDLARSEFHALDLIVFEVLFRRSQAKPKLKRRTM